MQVAQGCKSLKESRFRVPILGLSVMKNSLSVDSLGRYSLPGSLHSHSASPKSHSHKVVSSGTLDLWQDGLLCAYEFIPAHVKKIKVGGEFGQIGPVQGRFDAEFSLKHPQGTHDHAALHLNRSNDSLGQQPEDLKAGSLASGAGSLSTEVQGFVARESLRKNKEDTVSPSGTVHGTHSHGRRSKKESSSQWIPVGWHRLAELFQTVQVRRSYGDLNESTSKYFHHVCLLSVGRRSSWIFLSLVVTETQFADFLCDCMLKKFEPIVGYLHPLPGA